MRDNWIHPLICILSLSALWQSTGQEVNRFGALQWRNGDVLPGRLLESPADSVRWASDLFLDELEIRNDVLESIRWETPLTEPEGDFLIVTKHGDRFTADLKQADAEAIAVEHPRFGDVSIALESIRSITRRDNERLLFDGATLDAWNSSATGPIKKLRYALYHGNWQWDEDFPDLRTLKPHLVGSYPSGYIQTELGGMARKFAMIFEGEIEIQTEGVHLFQLRGDDIARLFLNEQLLMEAGRSSIGTISKSIQLKPGPCRLRLEFLNYGGAAYAEASYTNPDGRRVSLSGDNPNVGWFNSKDLVPETEENQAELSHRLNLPDQYEILIDLSSKKEPRFVLTLGEDNTGIGFRSSWSLETWDNELILLKDEIFQSILTLDDDQDRVQLRILADKKARRLLLLDGERQLIAEFNNSDAATGLSELRLRNRGDHLHLDTLNILERDPAQMLALEERTESIFFFNDGSFFNGILLHDQNATVITNETAQLESVRLDQLDRMEFLNSDREPSISESGVMLVYSDGSILRGSEVALTGDAVRLSVDYSTQPLLNSYDHLNFIRWGIEAQASSSAEEDVSNMDVFRSPKATLHGRLEFNESSSPLTWKPYGSEKSVRLSNRSGFRIERNASQTRQGASIDLAEYPSILHLVNGEALPGSVELWEDQTIQFNSPFLEQNVIPASEIRAIDFSSSEPLPELNPTQKERALTVPRMYRANAPRHLLVARNGDMLRGKALGIRSQNLVFESRSRDFEIPLERLSILIGLEMEGASFDSTWLDSEIDNHGKVRATLTDGSVFEFTARSIRDGMMTGRSLLYGNLSIPTEFIRELTIGDFENWRNRLVYEDWKMKPAKEPDFGEETESAAASGAKQEPFDTSNSVSSQARRSEQVVDQSSNINLPAVQKPVPSNEKRDGSVLLGSVQINPTERTLRFPVIVNQKEGLVEYALVSSTGKTHESVFKTDTDPLHIHLGLLMLKGKPVYAKTLSAAPADIPPGDEVEISVLWDESGQERRQRLGRFIVTTNNGNPLTPAAWRYNGSIMTPGGIIAQSSGSIVSLRLDAEAILNNPRPGRLNDDLHYVNTKEMLDGEGFFELKINN